MAKRRSKEEERRRNYELRERLDQLLDLARDLSRDSANMSKEELDRARMRIEWLAEEIWRAAVYGPLEGRAGASPEPSDEGPNEK